MVLENIRKNADRTGGYKMNGVALSSWDNNLPIVTRKRLRTAVKMAGLKPIALMHENTAAVAY